MLPLILLCILLVCAFKGGELQSRVAIASFGLIYLSTEIPFGLFDLDLLLSPSEYLFTLSTLSLIQIVIYCNLRMRPGIIVAASCEAVLLVLYLLAAVRLDAVVELRLALWHGANIVALLALAGNWLDGYRRNRAGDTGIRNNRAHRPAAWNWRVLPSQKALGMGQNAERQMP